MAKSTSKKKARQPQPKLLMLIACDAVSRDPSTGKASIYGIFHTINTPVFPCIFRPFALFGELTGTGNLTIELWISPPSKKPQKIADMELALVNETRAVLDMQIAGYPFEKTGEYEFQIRCGGEVLQPTCRITAKLIPSTNEGA